MTLKEIADRIQTFEVASANPSAKVTCAGQDIQELLEILYALVAEVRRIEAVIAHKKC